MAVFCIYFIASCTAPSPTPTQPPALINIGTAVQATIAAAPTDPATPTPPPTSTPAAMPTSTMSEPPASDGSLTASASGVPACIPPDAIVEVALVSTVADSDTVEVLIDGQSYTVCYLGLDGPSPGSFEAPAAYMGTEALAYHRGLVHGQVVMLVGDNLSGGVLTFSESDQGNCLPRYVFVRSLDGLFVNYEMVRHGYATVHVQAPDGSCQGMLQEAEGLARQEQLGLWQATPTVTPSPTPAPTNTPPPAPKPLPIPITAEPDDEMIYCDCCRCY